MSRPVVSLAEVTAENWREIAAVAPRDDQRELVAPTAASYMLLAAREGIWTSLGVVEGDRVVGHAMWAVDPGDGKHWVGGVIIDAPDQGRGLGRAAMEALIEYLRDRADATTIRLSYEPGNAPAAGLYGTLGFVPTGEMEGDELVVELTL